MSSVLNFKNFCLFVFVIFSLGFFINNISAISSDWELCTSDACYSYNESINFNSTQQIVLKLKIINEDNSYVCINNLNTNFNFVRGEDFDNKFLYNYTLLSKVNVLEDSFLCLSPETSNFNVFYFPLNHYNSLYEQDRYGNWSINDFNLFLNYIEYSSFFELNTDSQEDLFMILKNPNISFSVFDEVVSDFNPPIYYSSFVENIKSGDYANFYLTVSDDVALENNGYYVFSTNNSGIWINDSAVSFTTTPQTIKTIKLLNLNSGISIGYRWYLYDNAGNENITPVYDIVTPYPPEEIPYGIEEDINVIPLTECQIISSPGNYSLSEDVSSIGTCFIISVENVTLNCNNYKINYSTSGAGSNYGLYSKKSGTIVKNCNIFDGYDNSLNTNRHAIYFSNVENGALKNNNLEVYSPSSYGIYIRGSSNNNLISNNAFSNKSTGISLYSNSNNNILISNNGSSNLGTGIQIYSSNYTTLVGNSGNSVKSYGIQLLYVAHTNLTSNNGTSTSENYNSGNNGLYLSNAAYNLFVSNIGTSNGGMGIGISQNSHSNLFISNTGRTNKYRGIYLTLASAYNNTFISNIAISNQSDGSCIKSNNNTFISNTFISNLGSGILFDAGSYNTLINNTGISNSGAGIRLYSKYSGYNTLINNTGISNSGAGIFLYTSSGNNLISNTGTSVLNRGIYIHSNSNNNFLTLSNATGVYGIYIENSFNNSIVDCVNVEGLTKNIYLSSGLIETDNTFLNCS
jgi:parallel beta-helix repeat protein